MKNDGVKIIFPEGSPKTAVGTIITTSCGAEISGVTELDIVVRPDQVVYARMNVLVSEVENADELDALISVDGDSVSLSKLISSYRAERDRQG